MGKAIFFDIDGTLVNFQGRMPASTEKALRQMQRNGHRIVICTGRSACQIYSWLLNMKFDGIIAAAGAYVECDGRIIYEHYMEGEAFVTTMDLLERVDASYAAQTKDSILVATKNKNRLVERFSAMGMDGDAVVHFSKSLQVDDQIAKRNDIEKFAFFDARITTSEIREALSDYCDVTLISLENPTEYAGEIICKGINKSLGIQKYIEYTNIAREDTIAFGDSANDIEMIEYAHVGIAMGNAIEELKRRADYVTTGIDEDGIACALKKLGLYNP